MASPARSISKNADARRGKVWGVIFVTKSSSGFALLRKRSENDTPHLPSDVEVGCGASGLGLRRREPSGA
ncbi:MAG TPA: hypothetical protein VGM61_01585, partial [Pinirhizobacter sp.]